MTVCAVIDLITKKQVNTIIAEPTDIAPDGCFLIKLSPGFVWNGTELVPYTPPPTPDEEAV